MRKPNGYGSVIKLKGNRRKPWTARITVGWDLNEKSAKQVYRYIGYYESRQEAEIALAKHNDNPRMLTRAISMDELFNIWNEAGGFAESTTYKNKSMWKTCKSIHDTSVDNIDRNALQAIISHANTTERMGNELKYMWSKMLKYGVLHGYVLQDKVNMVSLITTEGTRESQKIERIPFTRIEINDMWFDPEKNLWCLILLYTGMRAGELLDLTTDDIHLRDRYIDIKKSKTASGIRQVPIAKKIYPLLEDLINTQKGMLCNCTYPTFKTRFDKLYAPHKPHDTRHTFISLLTEADVDERIIKQIVGHKGQGVTESVYTHISLSKKLEAVNKI